MKLNARMVPAEPVTRYREECDYHCDRCGKVISPDGDGYAFRHEMIVAIDQDQCVSTLRQRDLCPECLEVIEKVLRELLGTRDDDREA